MTYNDETTRQHRKERDESTETIVRRHVKIHVEKEMAPIRQQMIEYTEATKVMATQSMDQLKIIHDVQAAHQATLYGKMPPDEKDPGIWRIVTDLRSDWRRIKDIIWRLIFGFIGAVGVGLAAYFGIGH